MMPAPSARERQGDVGGELAPGGGDVQVVRAEVVAPLREAVRLVHHQQAHGHARQGLEEGLVAQAFGRDEQDLVFAPLEAAQALELLGGGEAGVDEGGGDVAPGERVHLILHQRHERGDHQRHIRLEQGAELVDERLARAGGHDDERVAPRDDVLEGLGLPRAEMRKGEVAAQRRVQLHGGLGHDFPRAKVRPEITRRGEDMDIQLQRSPSAASSPRARVCLPASPWHGPEMKCQAFTVSLQWGARGRRAPSPCVPRLLPPLAVEWPVRRGSATIPARWALEARAGY
ncbi:MAG TPA: hypothetical protein VEU50_26970 [Archangium sp.]|nr:hypothetical protein [Archangium sp.]HYO56436.1 hypothetical protein [Archangium sp.]